LRDQAREFERRNVQVLVVTTDARVRERGAHAILADRAATVSATYGVAFQMIGTANRPATFVIDRDGVVRFAYRAGQTPGRVFDRDGLVEGAHWSYDRPSMSQLLRVLDDLPGTPALDRARKDKVARLDKATIAALAEALGDEDSYVRAEAAKRLAQKGPDAKEAVPALSKALGDKVGYVRSEAALALSKLGPSAKSSVPKLIEAMKDPDEGVRLAAGVALRDLGPEAKAAVPALKKALKDDDERVRRAAQDALEEVGRKK
jgi:hypothetical protein